MIGPSMYFLLILIVMLLTRDPLEYGFIVDCSEFILTFSPFKITKNWTSFCAYNILSAINMESYVNSKCFIIYRNCKSHSIPQTIQNEITGAHIKILGCCFTGGWRDTWAKVSLGSFGKS